MQSWLVTVLSNQLIWLWARTSAWLSPAHSIWAVSSPIQNGGLGSTQFFFCKRKNQKYFFGILQFSRVFFYVILINIGQYFYVAKNTKSNIKIPDFRQNFQNTKR
jgi:hypothetical protein